jgi:type I restriction enzyme S subunit
MQKLSDICFFADGRVAVAELDLDTYISTENMLPNKEGISRSAGLPTISQTQSYKEGDVLISNIRPYFRKIWLADCDGGCSNDVLVLRAKENCNPAFLYYVLTDDNFFEYATVTAKGTKMPRGDKTAIMLYEVPKLPMNIQIGISDVLSAIDAKIANNKKINHHLEQMAQTIFNKSMSKNTSKTVELRELCSFQEGYVNPSQNHPEYFDGTVKWLRAVDINESFIINTSRTLSQLGYESAGKSACLFKPDTIAISKSGTIGRLGIISDFMCGNRAVINIIPNEKRLLPFIHLYLKSRQAEFPNLAVGSVQKNLYVSLLQPLIVELPHKVDLFELCDSLQPIYDQIRCNVSECASLIVLRDTLLPKLMSGELSVSDISSGK